MRYLTKILLGLLTLLPISSTLADGFIIIPRPRPIPPHRRIPIIRHYFPLSVKYHRVYVNIQNQIANTKIDQTFFNPNRWQLEGTYIFPLPEGATIKSFSMWMNGKQVSGELLDKDKARRIYENIVRKMKDPGLLEYVGTGMYRARVFPIPARGTVRIQLEYSQTLRADQGMVEYIYPLNTEKFSSQPLEEVSVSVDIRSPYPIKTIYSPSHKVDIIRHSPNHIKVGFERNRVKPNRDFILYFSQSSKEFALDLISTKPNPSKPGYFLLLLSPDPNLKKKKIMAKDIVFILDTSGSMIGDKIEQAKRALRYCIQSLGEKDRFAVVDFSTEARKMEPTLVAANAQNKKNALQYIHNLEARGGTNLEEALTYAFGYQSNEKKRPFLLCLITDGEPTIGKTEPKEILAEVKKWNQAKARIFVVGIGHDLNAKLLDKLAEEHKGSRTYILEQENLEVKLSHFYDKISHPALSDLRLTFQGPGIRVSEIYPKQLPDLFMGSQLKILGRYQGSGSVAIVLKGKYAGKEVSFTYEKKFQNTLTSKDIPLLWANRKIAYLLEQIRLNGERPELKQEIVRLAKKFGIVTPYTSYLVLEDTQRRIHRSGRALREGERKRAQAFGAPAGRPMAPAMEKLKKQFQGAIQRNSGKDAVKGSLRLLRLKKNANLEDLENHKTQSSKYIKKAYDKIFYLIDGVWVDSTYQKDLKITRIKLFSQEYFQLISKNPRIAKYLSVGKRVRFVLNNKAYEIEE